MSDVLTTQAELAACSPLANLLHRIPSGRRAAVLQSVVSFRPSPSLENSFAVGPLRAAFADYWEHRFGQPVPVESLRAALDPPVPIGTVLEFNKLALARDLAELDQFLSQLVRHVCQRMMSRNVAIQGSLFEVDAVPGKAPVGATIVGESVASLAPLVASGRKFPTVYADPPWPYENEASRAAAVNHYPTLTLTEIENEPVGELVAANAHLHLWTTNGFLREAFHVIEAWGFEFKSCLVWVKGDLGMGNYWRVSHEFLLLGVRGSLTFRDRTLPSWISADRTIHSRKPGVIRSLIERVSPGPYLEL